MKTTNRCAVLLGVLLGTVLFAQPSMVLYDFQEAVPEKLVEHRQASTKWLGKGRFHVHLDAQGQWPGITLNALNGKWDLTPYANISITLKNVGKHKQSIGFRVDNPGANGTTNCLQEKIELAPGKSGMLTVPIARKVGNMTVNLFGMRGYPAEVGGSKTGFKKTIDPSNVIGILVFAASPAYPVDVEVESIIAHDDYVAKNVKLIKAEEFFPFIDTYGQYIHRDWPGKVKDAADLASRIPQEEKDLAAHPGSACWDKWGGWADGPSFDATGFFRTMKYNGKWWLVDPDGKLFFSHGIDCVGLEGSTPIEDRETWFKDFVGNEPEFKDCNGKSWHVVNGYYAGRQPKNFNFLKANLKRKFGADWFRLSSEMAHRRLRSWGHNTIANWSQQEICLMRKTPYFATLNTGGKMLEGSTGYWGKFRDVFDPSFTESIKKNMEKQRGKSVDDPWCIGYFVDNEIAWGDDVSLAIASLKSPKEQAAKIEFVNDLKAKYGDIGKLNAVWGTAHASWEALLESREAPDKGKAGDDLHAFYAKFAATYFRTIRDALKAVAPHQLYVGCRFAWVNKLAAEAAGTYCDIVSYNIYKRNVSSFKYSGSKDVPLIIGEFHFGALDRGMFHTGLVTTANQQDRANHYKSYVESVLCHPQFVGCHWFKYRDEPTTGRGLDGENYQIGFADIVDTPYPEIINAS
ncbi:MAG: beta-galactosidase, partial [Victivallales bacterium]|nr:beta-galactosidase [Victivallales bacterium]